MPVLIEDLRAEFTRLKEETLSRVKEAATAGDVQGVSRFTRIAEDCQKAIAQLDDLKETAKAIESRLKSPGDDALLTLRSRWASSLESMDAPPRKTRVRDIPSLTIEQTPRERGMATRSGWLQNLRDQEGIFIKDFGRYRYETDGGLSVCIAFGTELGGKPDSWFLGVPNEEFDVIVLLSETRDGQLLDFVIPAQDLADAWEDISTGRHGRQRKVNIIKSNGNFYLVLPGKTRVSIGKYLGNYGALRGN